VVADSLDLAAGLSVSGSTDTLAAYVAGERPGRFSLVLGYSGWSSGQLETEIEENSWLVAPATASIIFDIPYDDRWVAALNSIGVDPGTLVDFGSSTPV